MTAKPNKTVRCAIYTRVSTDQGLEQDFNSLDAQYDASQAYIRSQVHAGWKLIRTKYDDGGFSGGTLLVAGQSIIFLAYPRSCQPILQALFAMGSVVAPATIAPALQGWLIDSQSWAWIFFSVVPVAFAAIGLLLIADGPRPVATSRLPFDWTLNRAK